MENILELIITLVAGFFWLFGGSLFKRRQEDETPQPTPSRRSNRRESDQSSSEQEGRQRDIREAIRRKIAERLQQSDSEPVWIPEPEPQDLEQYTESQEDVSKPIVYAESSREEIAEAPFSGDIVGSAYGEEMQKRLEAIEATKRRAEALKKEAKQVMQDHYATDREKSSKPQSILSIGSVQAALKNPENVRAAFVYAEILGKPVGLRSSSQGGIGE